MSDAARPTDEAAAALDVLIDRVAEAVVSKLDEQRKIDAIAHAVLQRIQVRAPYAEPGVNDEAPQPTPAGEGTE